MKKLSTLTATILASSVLCVGLPRLGFGAEPSELDQLKSTVKQMEQTIQEMNRKITEMEKQRATPAPAVQPEPTVSGLTPATHPGDASLPLPKAGGSKSGLADKSTQIPDQDTIHDDQLSSPRPGNAPIDPSYQGFMQLFGTFFYQYRQLD